MEPLADSLPVLNLGIRPPMALPSRGICTCHLPPFTRTLAIGYVSSY